LSLVVVLQKAYREVLMGTFGIALETVLVFSSSEDN